MTCDIKYIASFLKSQKQREISRDINDADLNPHIIVEKDGKPAAIFIAPKNTNKFATFKAAMLCKVGFEPDSITVAFDAIIRNFRDEKIDKDCIIIQKIDTKKNIQITTLPYDVYGENIVWDDDLKDELSDTSEAYGDMTERLKSIMSVSTNNITFEGILKDVLSQEDGKDFSREQCIFHTSRATMSFLMSMGFKIIDLLSYKHPEWTEAKTVGEKILNKMVEANVISEEQKTKLYDIVKNHIGTIAFKERFEHQLTVAKCKLPTKKMKLFTFVNIFEQMCIQPQLSDSFVESLSFNLNDDDCDGDGVEGNDD